MTFVGGGESGPFGSSVSTDPARLPSRQLESFLLCKAGPEDMAEKFSSRYLQSGLIDDPCDKEYQMPLFLLDADRN